MIRITRLWIEEFKNIKRQNFDLANHNGLTLLIGNNGSGKSNVLEFISNVFKNLFRGETDFRSNFEIEWEADGNTNKMKFYNGHLTEERNGSAVSVNNTMDYPKRVIAIYSGESERLWHNFYKPSYDTFISNINQNQQQGSVNVNTVFPKLLYLNRFYWDVALLSLLCSDSPDVQDFLMHGVGIQQVNALKFGFKDSQTYANFAINPVLQFVHQIDGKTEYTLDEFKQILDNANIDAQQLFEYLYIAFSPKNSKIIESVVVKFNTNLTIEDMSEGLKKRLLVRAALELAGHEDTLFLLDEPDAHVHVDNKVNIIETIKQFKLNRHIFVTTHSPSVCKDVDAQSIILMNSGKPEAVNNQLEAGKKLATDVVLINMLFTNKHLILTEGKTDIQYIQKAVSLFAANYPTLAGAVEFVELSGTDGDTDLDFMSKITPIAGRKIIRLVDRDDAGLTCARKILKNDKLKCSDFTGAKTIPSITNASIVMLPMKANAPAGGDFLIEDYFKEDKVKELGKNLIDTAYNGVNFKRFPPVKTKIKEELLPAFCPTATDADMEDFKKLLDLLEQTLTV
jgi:ABC-type multidrug transport system ATPase subunit